MAAPPSAPPRRRPRAPPGRFEREHAGCWPWGHLLGWRGPSGFGSRATARDVVRAYLAASPRGGGGALRGRTAIVTGGNAGIGLATAEALARAGLRVVLACRDPAAAERAAEKIRAKILRRGEEVEAARPLGEANHAAAAAAAASAAAAAASSVVAFPAPLDLASFASVRAFAARVLAELPTLHVLVHNAGVMPSRFRVTEDGHEATFQVNVLAPVLLTHLLTPLLVARGASENHDHAPRRVVFVASAAHRYAYARGSDEALDRTLRVVTNLCETRGRGEKKGVFAEGGDFFWNRREIFGKNQKKTRGDDARRRSTLDDALKAHDPVRAYGFSKFAQIALAPLLNARFRALRPSPDSPPVTCDAAHPGAVLTAGSERARRDVSGWRGAAVHAIGRPFLKTPEGGAATVVHACLRGAGDGGGRYFVNCNVARPERQAARSGAARRLWEAAEAATKKSA